MIKKLFLLLLITAFIYSFQDAGLKLHKSIPVQASYFTTDHLENAYVIKEDVLQKYDTTGKVFKTFTNKSLGRITSVDASNPLKLLLFYKDFSQIIFLDNMLSMSADLVKLADLGFEQTQLACSSHNSGLWLYNLQNFELIRLDQNLAITQRTGNITQITGLAINPNFLIQYNNMVYLNSPSTGILVFDVYGTYYKNIPIKGLTSFQVRDESIFYFSNKELKSFDMKKLSEENYTISDSSATMIRPEKDRLFLLKKNSLEIYQNK